MARNRRHELGVGVLVLVAAGLLAWMALQVGALRGFGKFVHVSARLDDAAGLTEGAEVKVAGVVIGRVEGLRVEDGRARVDLAIRQDAGIPSDAQVAVRARSVLGEKYIDVVGGTDDARPIADGDTLASAPPPTEIDQLVDQVGQILSTVDPAALSRSLAAFDDALTRDPQRVERMVDNLDRFLEQAVTASEELPALIADGRTALGEVEAAAREARPVIARADAVLDELEGAAGGLDRTRSEVDGLIADTRDAVQAGRAVIGRLDDNGDRIERILANLEEIDKWELRRLLREEGILVRLRAHQVVEDDAPGDDAGGEAGTGQAAGDPDLAAGARP